MDVGEERRAVYRAAYDDWQKQLASLHDVLLDGKPLAGDKMKGLLNREARAKERYDQARLALLGIGEPAESPFD
jgi:hypothetical protein